jgi:hypothetical protein
MAGPDYIDTTGPRYALLIQASFVTSSDYSNSNIDDTNEVFWFNVETHRAFLRSIEVRFPFPNPLSILMRAVNAVKARFNIRQYRWSKLRWRSTT